jgi:hypothetical protein
MTGISTNADRAQTALANQNATNHVGLNAITSIGTGLANGGVGVAGGLSSAAANAASTSLENANRNSSQALRSSAANAGTGAQNNNSAYLRDTNKSLADFSARGDYQNAIAGIQSKIQDAALTQPTTSGQVGGESINLIHGNVELSIRWKTIDAAAQSSIGEYWLRYGYAVEQFSKIDRLMVMTKFTYWKLKETYIRTAPMPESYRQAIRGMFEKGVTLWADPDDIGVIDMADNKALDGVTL